MKKSSTWMMLAPGLIILLLCLGLPLISVLAPTFTAGQYPLSAYVEFFQDEYYRKILFRTLKIAVITTGICMAGGIPTAYFISRCDKKWRGLLLAASIFPMMTNSVIRSFAWINILGSNGIINRILLALNVADKPMKLLYTDLAIIIGSVYLFLPLMIVTVTGVMENIDDDMMEAAQSLGAGRFEAFMKVIFPMSLPGNYSRRYPCFHRNPHCIYNTSATWRKQQYGSGNSDLSESHVCRGLERGFCSSADYDRNYSYSNQGL